MREDGADTSRRGSVRSDVRDEFTALSYTSRYSCGAYCDCCAEAGEGDDEDDADSTTEEVAAAYQRLYLR